jgi:nitroimidazol reductase NimA-like FMN-containing flavoprotein (pyridoxamine 5'-phosphate oxidase superfamily)
MQHDMVMNVLTGPLAQEMLHSPLIARLGYNGLDGAPRVVPVGFLWDGTSFIVCTATMAPKVRALRTNPKVALTIDTDAQPPHILLVRGTANVEIVDGVPDEFLEASKKVMPPEQWSAFEADNRALYPQMARITIQPEWAKLIDFETVLPRAVDVLISAKS